MRSRGRSILVLAITVALLAFFFRNTDLAGVWTETRRADPVLLLLGTAATLVNYLARAWRWQFLLAPIGPTRFGTAFRTTVIGFAVSFIIPRAGEVIRPYLLARKENLKPTAAFATIILERLLDLVTVLLLFSAFVFTIRPGVLSGDPAQLAHIKFWGGVAAAAAVGGLGILTVLAGHPERLGRAAARVERVLPARAARVVAHFVESFTQGLAVLRSPANLLGSLVLSFPLWLSIAAGVWLTSRAFHITFPYTGSFLVLTLLVVGVAVPTPGSVGGFHVAYQIAVQTFFAAPPDRAAGAAILLHAMSFVPVTVVGIILMAREGLTLSGAQRIADSGTPERPSGQSGVMTR